MPVLKAHDEDHRQRPVRRVVAVRGSARISMRMAARPDYGLAKPKLDRIDGDVSLALSATVDLEIDGDDVTADLALSAGESTLFVLEVQWPGVSAQQGSPPG